MNRGSILSITPALEPSQIQSFLTNSSLYKNKYARLAFFSLGVGLVALRSLSLIKTILRPLFRFRRDLAARYGKGSWALITGASSGIGRGYALELARRGFNIILVSENEEELKIVEHELKQAVPTVQTRVIVADFVNAHKDGFAEGIHKQARGLDISILINNAGVVGQYDPLHQISNEVIVKVLMINSLSHALITRIFLPQLNVRKNRSAIITMASIAGITPMPYSGMYGTSKILLDFLSRGLNYEHPNLDILSMRPSLISTRLTNYQKPNSTIITVEEYVKSSLGELGYVNYSYGHWRHSWVPRILLRIPEFMKPSMYKGMNSHFKDMMGDKRNF